MKNPLLYAIISLFTAGALALAPTEENAIGTLPRIKPGDPMPANIFIELDKLVNPAVVNIFTSTLPQRRVPNDPYQDPLYEFFPFMGPQGREQALPQQSLGSGFLIREDGLILTNNHVVEEADLIKVQIEERGKEQFVAKIVGRDPRSDIALIKIDAHRKLPFLRLGSSAEVQRGEWVAAFGNPFGWGHSESHGIISGLGRDLEDINLNDFMQTDASINPGNSGGPLVNLQGLVIGVNTAVDKRGPGIGFAIPIDAVKGMLPSLERDGEFKRGFIGVTLFDDKDREGALIRSVAEGTPADISGVRPGDLVVEFNGRPIANYRDLIRMVTATPIGETVPIRIVRGGKTLNIKITVSTTGELKTSQRGKASPKDETQEKLAPYNLGFGMIDLTPSVARQLRLPIGSEVHPLIVSVDSASEAARVGLAPGDQIAEVRGQKVSTVKDVFSQLRNGKINILRINKPGRTVLVSMRAS